jgi:Domain of unknown function (DUF4157)
VTSSAEVAKEARTTHRLNRARSEQRKISSLCAWLTATPRASKTVRMVSALPSAGLEQLPGLDMSDVQVQYNSPKPAEIHALAYAQGNQIHVGPGQERHLPHEAWHVVQQKHGRVRPSAEGSGPFLPS